MNIDVDEAEDVNKYPTHIAFFDKKGRVLAEHDIHVTVDTNIMFKIWRLKLRATNPDRIVRTVIDIAL